MLFHAAFSAFATTACWPIAIAPKNWSYAAGCWQLPAPICFLSLLLAAIGCWRSLGATSDCARSAGSAFSYGCDCSPATVRFPCAWTPHEAYRRKLATTQALSCRQGTPPVLFTLILQLAAPIHSLR